MGLLEVVILMSQFKLFRKITINGEANDAICFPLRFWIAFFQSKLVCISASLGLDSFERESRVFPLTPETADTTADLNLISSEGEKLC